MVSRGCPVQVQSCFVCEDMGHCRGVLERTRDRRFISCYDAGSPYESDSPHSAAPPISGTLQDSSLTPCRALLLPKESCGFAGITVFVRTVFRLSPDMPERVSHFSLVAMAQPDPGTVSCSCVTNFSGFYRVPHTAGKELKALPTTQPTFRATGSQSICLNITMLTVAMHRAVTFVADH